MKTVWTKGLNPEQQNELRKEFIAAHRFRERLVELLEDKSRVKRNSSFKNDSYESPAWAYQQADAIGYEKAISEIISLISEKVV